ncbi:MAG: enoyl-CoA hydratase/isomerase family protein, partial [Candidatus Methylomirabilis sp.]|nr:enoyl-CoA hydratase/isomerase family protein [Deltaproteobacteria bacterium]
EDAPSQEALQRAGYYKVIKPLQAIFTAVAECRVPVIAAVGGAAAGAGMELALCADIRVASEDAEFWIPEVRYGLVPDMGGTQRLAWLVGPSRAKELILTGKKISAARALEIGLVDHVVPRGEAVKRAEELAREIADQAPLAVQAAKRSVNASMEMGLRQGLEYEAREAASCLPTEDVFEGFMAAMEKRAPRFKGA